MCNLCEPLGCSEPSLDSQHRDLPTSWLLIVAKNGSAVARVGTVASLVSLMESLNLWGVKQWVQQASFSYSLCQVGTAPSTSQPPRRHGILLNPCQVGIVVPIYQMSLSSLRLRLSYFWTPSFLCPPSPLSICIYYVVGFPCHFQG